MVAMVESPTHGDYATLESGEPHTAQPGDDFDIPVIPFLIKLYGFLAFCYGLMWIGSLLLTSIDPEFSIKITGIQGLEDLNSPAAISPLFNLTIHVDNKQSILWKACRPKSVVTMYHGDESLAWGELPAFCVGKGSATDLNVSLSSSGAILSRKLRDKMADDLSSTGELHLSVMVKPTNPEDATEACLVLCQTAPPEPACPHLCYRRKALY